MRTEDCRCTPSRYSPPADRAAQIAVLAGFAACTGHSEQQFSEFVKRGVAPKSVLFGRNARRFKRSEIDACYETGGPSAYASKGDPGAVCR